MMGWEALPGHVLEQSGGEVGEVGRGEEWCALQRVVRGLLRI